MVPYYVMKKPSEPSLMGSLISYIGLLPTSLSRIQQSIHILIPMKTRDTNNAKKAIKLDVLLDTSRANKINNTIGDPIIIYLTAIILSSFSL